jgi:L-amino acid N-acyltransferase YncA
VIAKAMAVPGYELAVAGSDDLPAILDLQERNLRERGGALSVRFPVEWFVAAIRGMPLVVAKRGAHVVGYAVSTPIEAQAHDPIVKAMLAAYPPRNGAYIYGPICVTEEHRGKGLAIAMFEELRSQLPGREGFTFIRADNAVSRKVHERMGLREVAQFVRGQVAYVVVAYNG